MQPVTIPSQITAAYADSQKRLQHSERRVEALEVRLDRSQALPGSWPTKLRILRALYAKGGRVRAAVSSISLAPSVAYYHKSHDRLFSDCWDYVKAYAKRDDDRPAWSAFWPVGLSDPTAEAAAGVANLVRRLVKADVLVRGRG